MTKTIYSW